MNVSFINAQSIAPTGDYIQTPGKEKTGTLMQQIDLVQILKSCKTLKKANEKHQNGSIFPYISKTLGKESWTNNDGLTDGVIFVDIDNITKQAAETIFDKFEDICNSFPCLYAIQYSSSYYLSDKKAGLHLYISSSILNEEEYKYLATLALALIARYILITTGIDLRTPMVDNNVILDSHNTSIMQRFYLYYSDYKINDSYCEIFTDGIYDPKSIKQLKKEYSMLAFPATDVTYISEIKLDAYDANLVKQKICIDRNFHIGKYNGNDVRWRISRIAQILFKDAAQAWCDKYFYYENGKSIFSKQTSEKFPSLIVKNWLEDNHYLVSNQKNLIRRGEYITKYTKEIMEFVESHRRAEIIAPTGVGKTTLINNYLAQQLNAIVIVPFNVTNRLYDNMLEVSSENYNNIEPDKPAVMIWDQALKYWDDVKNRTLIIDEAHCLFLDRTYRDTAVQLMKKIKQDNCKFVMFTATPSGEGHELGCDYLQFNSDRGTIMTDFMLVNNIDIAQYNYIRAALRNHWFDKIVLFDDTTAKKIYEKLYCDGEFINDIAYIRSDTKNSKDFKNLRNLELLTKRLTICTCVAFNGLNFRNKGERILVITSFNKGTTTSCEIIQEAGRIRNSEVYLKIYIDGKDKVNNIESKIQEAKIMSEIEASLGIPTGLLKYNKRLIDSDIQEALKSIQEYLNVKSDIDVIIDELKEAGYFYMRAFNSQDEKRGIGNRMNLAFKKKESDEFIKDLLEGTVLEKEYEPDNSQNYKLNWQNQIKHMLNNNTYTGVSLQTIQDLYKNSNKNILVSTGIDRLYRIIGISMIGDDEWNEYINHKDNVVKLLGGDVVSIKKVIGSYNANSKIRNKYRNKIKVKDNCIDLSVIMTDTIENTKKEYNSERAGKSNAKKKALVITALFNDPLKYDLAVGQKFCSCSELSQYTGKSIQTISSWIKKSWIQEKV